MSSQLVSESNLTMYGKLDGNSGKRVKSYIGCLISLRHSFSSRVKKCYYGLICPPPHMIRVNILLLLILLLLLREAEKNSGIFFSGPATKRGGGG